MIYSAFDVCNRRLPTFTVCYDTFIGMKISGGGTNLEIFYLSKGFITPPGRQVSPSVHTSKSPNLLPSGTALKISFTKISVCNR